MTGVCPLCLRSAKLTDEDTTPIWVRKLLAAEFPAPTGVDLPPRQRVKICGDCNGNLNRVMEIPGKPVVERLIRGEQVHLSQEEARLASLWMLKHAIVLRVCRPLGQPGFLTASRIDGLRRVLLRMLRTQTPPRFASVRAGMYLPSEMIDSPLAPAPFYVGAGTVLWNSLCGVAYRGFLAFECVVMLGGDLRGDVFDVAPDDRLARLWPDVPEGGVAWPAAQPLGDGDLDALREAWAHPPEVHTRQQWVVDPDRFRERHGL